MAERAETNVEPKINAEALREIEEKLRGIESTTKDAIAYATLEGILIEVNNAFCRLTGYSQQELANGKKYQDITPKEYQELEAKIVQQILRTGEPAEYEKEYLRKDGSRVPVRLTVLKILAADRQTARLMAVAKDMSERKQAEEAMRKAYGQTEILLSSIPSILIGISESGRVIHWNAVAEGTFGVAAGKVLNRPFSECALGCDTAAILAGIANCQARRSIVRVDDVRFRRPDGKDGFLGITIIPVRQDKEGHVEYILFGADITERRRVDHLKNEFVSMVSHELRTPLTVIREGVSQVLEGILGEINQDQRQILTIAFEGIERLGRIVDDLLDISKIEAGKLEIKRELMDMTAVVKQVLSAFGSQLAEKALKLKTNFPPKKVELYADRDKMTQLVTNLMSNAIKFTQQGSIEVSVEAKGDTVECRVKDTGIGISGADLPKVFNKFQQFSAGTAKGTGLGLVISKGIAEGHHGSLEVESVLGEGTQFCFRLPKYTAKELFREYVAEGLRAAVAEEVTLSVLLFDVKNFDKTRRKIGLEKTTAIVRELEGVIKQNLHRKADIAIKDTRAILVLLPGTGKEQALKVAERIRQNFSGHWNKERLRAVPAILWRVATFPEDGTTADAILAKMGAW